MLVDDIPRATLSVERSTQHNLKLDGSAKVLQQCRCQWHIQRLKVVVVSGAPHNSVYSEGFGASMRDVFPRGRHRQGRGSEGKLL